MKNITVLSSMTDFLNQEPKPSIFSRIKRLVPLAFTLLGLSPSSVWANAVEITRQSIVNNQVILRVKVVNKERVPIQGLKPEEFILETTDKQGNPVTVSPSDIQLISSEQTEPDPAYLIVLLDMSGSMKHPDLGETVKLKGATDGLQDFLTQIQQENLPVQVALVPFGEGCDNSYSVTDTIIDQKFEAAPYSNTKQELTDLAGVEVCAATNIYQPLSEAIRFLSIPQNIEDIAQKNIQNISQPNTPNLPDQDPVPPRLGVILFSDGFDVFRGNETQRFNDLVALMGQYPEITVHTMGYGEKLYQLRDRTKCSVSDSDLTVDNVLDKCKLYVYDQNKNRKNIINEFIVDQPRLKEIAVKTGGIDKFPGNPTEVIDSLRTFLTTLREYEIRFPQPDADRGSQHTTLVMIDSPSRGLEAVKSQEVTYRMDNFVYQSLPFPQRMSIFIGTVLLGSGGYVGFRRWSKNLVDQSQSYLSD